MPTLKKGFYHPISILILALITLTVALAIFANSGFFSNKNVPTPSQSPQPSPNKSPTGETVNWKTYKSDQIMFSIKYPDNVKVEETPGGVVFYTGTKLTLPVGSIVDPYPNSLVILARGNNLSEAQVVGGSDLKETTVAGLPAYIMDRASSSTVSYWVYKNDKSNVVRINVEPKDDQKSYSTFLKILSSFQFLN